MVILKKVTVTRDLWAAERKTLGNFSSGGPQLPAFRGAYAQVMFVYFALGRHDPRALCLKVEATCLIFSDVL